MFADCKLFTGCFSLCEDFALELTKLKYQKRVVKTLKVKSKI